MSAFVTLIASSAAHRRVPVGLGVCLASFAVFLGAQRAAHVSMIDLMVYRAEGATVRDGGDLYALRATAAQLPTTYPPFAALLFTPLTLLDTAPLRVLATAANLALLVVFVRLSLKLVGHARVDAVWWVTAPAVWCEPVWTTLRYGQINLLLAVLVLWDLTRRPTGRYDRWTGAGLGLAAAVKLTPALFPVFLLVTGVAARLRGRDATPWLRQRAGQPSCSPLRLRWRRPSCRATPGGSGRTRCSARAGSAMPRTPPTRPCAAFWRAFCTRRAREPSGPPLRPSWPLWASRPPWRRSCAGGGSGRCAPARSPRC